METMTCDELREAFEKLHTDNQRRVLVIDVRSANVYERSHLCLSERFLQKDDSVRRQMRVMNIDPHVVRPTHVNNIQKNLSESDQFVFKRRSEANDIVIMDESTDNPDEFKRADCKVMCIFRALTNLDTTKEKVKLVNGKFPIKVLEGGYRAWHEQYRHWTTDPTYEPDLDYPLQNNIKSYSPTTISRGNFESQIAINQKPRPVLPPVTPPQVSIHHPMPPSAPPVHPASPRRPPISKPVPIPPTLPRPQPPAPKIDNNNVIRNAPGTAVPVTPSLSVRPALPRSHSSPNVAQADDSGDEIDELLNHMQNLNTPHSGYQQNAVNLNNNHLSATAVSKNVFKPIFDRSLKPSYNIELVNAIKAHLNFGNSYEASGRTQTGLQNLGNTCFMNSVIQCLAYTPTLVNYFCSDTYYSHINFHSQYGSKGELAIEFGALIEKVTLRRYKYIEPRSFRQAVRKHFGFADNEQQDSHEFMMMLFDKLHHDLNRHARDTIKQNGLILADSNNCNNNSGNTGNTQTSPEDALDLFWREHLKMNKSIISELFEGLFMSTLTCTYCSSQSNTYEIFNCLSLPISSTKSTCHIRECLTHFSNPERIDAAWKCPKCNIKRAAEKKIVIRKLPKILIIHLKRFSLADGRWRQKLETTVEFPLLDLVLPSTHIRNSYNLYAVVNHYGDLNGGHYTAFCKLESQQWFTFSDRDVSRMENSSVCSQAAYILFYIAK